MNNGLKKRIAKQLQDSYGMTYMQALPFAEAGASHYDRVIFDGREEEVKDKGLGFRMYGEPLLAYPILARLPQRWSLSHYDMEQPYRWFSYTVMDATLRARGDKVRLTCEMEFYIDVQKTNAGSLPDRSLMDTSMMDPMAWTEMVYLLEAENSERQVHHFTSTNYADRVEEIAEFISRVD